MAPDGCGSERFAGRDDTVYERRLVFDHVVDYRGARHHEQFKAVA
jgi:hypothetical protein